LTGGHVIDKHGGELILSKIGVTYGAHPVPDEGCVEGCKKILEMSHGLTEKDLVFTISGNGISSLLTLPVPGVTLEEIRNLTYIMQIERGAPTADLNPIRNHLDLMKGGKFTRYLQPAKCIHIILTDPGEHRLLMTSNTWHHTLPEWSTFEVAIENLKKWDAWDAVSPSIGNHLLKGDPQDETMKAHEFEKTDYRIFGILPKSLMIQAALGKANELSYRPIEFCDKIQNVEAKEYAATMACIAQSIETSGKPFEAPCALISSGELIVTVGKETGIGGRNQEWALSAALRIAGSRRVVFAGVDTDGTDGPGKQFWESGIPVPCLGGGIVDGSTLEEATRQGIDLWNELKRHNTSSALWRLGCGILVQHGVSIGDLDLVLIGPNE
jgi:glycerate 2-kinase